MTAAVDPTDRKAQAALLADIAALDFRAGRVDDAAACFRQLQQEFADVPCHAGMTPDQWLAAFPDGDDSAARSIFRDPRLAGRRSRGEAKPDTNEIPGQPRPSFEMPLEAGPAGPSLPTTPLLEPTSGSRLRDGTGHLQKPFRFRTAPAGGITTQIRPWPAAAAICR